MKHSRKVMLLAKAKKKDVKKPMTVEGQAARPRLDRPMRKRAEGGPVISDNSKREAAKLREEAEQDATSGVIGNAAGTLAGGLTMLARKKGPGILGPAAMLGGAGYGGKKYIEGIRKASEASRIEKGKAEEGKEDRKKGGMVCK